MKAPFKPLLTFSILVVFSYSASAQSVPVELSVGTIRTRLKQSATLAAVKYGKQFTADAVDGLTIIRGGKNNPRALFYYQSPSLDVQTGDGDSFNGVNFKVERNYVSGKTTDSGGFDADSPFRIYPVALGIEADRNFSKVNSLLEVGWIPYDLRPGKLMGLKPGKMLGLFLQAGVKSKIGPDNSIGANTGGAKDESKEVVGNAIFRVKGTASGTIPLLTFSVAEDSADSSKLLFLGDLTGWYDIKNRATYHKVDGTLRITLDKSRFFDFKLQSGSGAPNFNKGTQFTAGLTIRY